MLHTQSGASELSSSKEKKEECFYYFAMYFFAYFTSVFEDDGDVRTAGIDGVQFNKLNAYCNPNLCKRTGLLHAPPSEIFKILR